MIRIEKPTSNDKNIWLPLWNAYLEFYKQNLPEVVTALTWQRFFDEGVPTGAFVAFDGDEMVGFVHYIFHTSSWNTENYCYLEDLFVVAKYRGKGVGRQLIAKVKEAAKENKCPKVYWVTEKENTTAQELYNKVAVQTNFVQYKIDIE